MTRHVHEHDRPPSEGDLEALEDIVRDRIVDKGLIERFRLGLEFERFRGSEVGEQLTSNAMDRVLQSFQRWLEMDDPGSDEGRRMHLEGRSALQFLRDIDEAVKSGREAAAAIEAHDEVQEDVRQPA